MVVARMNPRHRQACQEEVDAKMLHSPDANTCFTASASCSTQAVPPRRVKRQTCPVCRVALTIDLQPSDLSGANKPPRNAAAQHKDELPSKSILSRIDLSQYTSSVKVDALLKGLNDMRSGKNGHLNKAIVFSQYTSMIEIVDWRLKKDRFHRSQAARQHANHPARGEPKGIQGGSQRLGDSHVTQVRR